MRERFSASSVSSVAKTGLVFAGVCEFLIAASAQVSFTEVVQQLKSPDVRTRLEAMRALREGGYPEASVPLAALLTDPEDEVQLEAIDAEVGLFLEQAIARRRRVAGIIEVRDRTGIEGLFDSGRTPARPVPGDVLAGLAAAMTDANPRVRFDATYALGLLGPSAGRSAASPPAGGAADTLARMLGDEDPALRYAAARVMGRFFKPADGSPIAPPHVPQAGDALINSVNDPDKGVQMAAMRALGDMRHERAVQALTDQFTYYGRGDRAEAALDGLARIAHPSSVPLLASLLTHKDAELRRLAIEGIGRSGEKKFVSEVQRLGGAERSEPVSLAITFALHRLGAAKAIDPLVSALAGRLRDLAREYLVELGTPAAPALYTFAQDKNPEIRRQVAEILGVTGGPGAIPALEPLIQDPDPDVATAAQRALIRLRAQPRRAS